jgi:hypothetical protein
MTQAKVDTTQAETSDWRHRLADRLPLFGHRNWIVVADSAYPAQSRSGIETVVAPEDQFDVVRTVWQALRGCTHVRAHVYTDEEMAFVAEDDARGISQYRDQLVNLFAGSKLNQLLHEEIIARLDQSAQVFRILIIKTNMTIPYTSVFFELDCGYWNAEAEDRVRRLIEASRAKIE